MNWKTATLKTARSVRLQLALAVTLAAALLNPAVAQESTQLAVEMNMSVPVTIACETDINGGVLNILDESVLTNTSASERSWGLAAGTVNAYGAPINNAAFAVHGASSGECTVGGLSDGSKLQITFTNSGQLNLTGDTTGNPNLTASLSVKDGAPDGSANKVDTTLVINTAAAGNNLHPAYTFDAGNGELTIPVGFMSIEIPQNADVNNLVGVYTGTGTVEITLL